MLVQGPQGNEALPAGIEDYERMVNILAKSSKAYWEIWGPLGEPMARSVDAWADMQRGYILWLRQSKGIGHRF
jgi:hypothetical protein